MSIRSHIGSLAGVAFALAGIAAFGVSQAGPGVGSPGQPVIDFYVAHRSAALTSDYLWGIAFACFLAFAATLRSRLEDGDETTRSRRSPSSRRASRQQVPRSTSASTQRSPRRPDAGPLGGAGVERPCAEDVHAARGRRPHIWSRYRSRDRALAEPPNWLGWSAAVVGWRASAPSASRDRAPPAVVGGRRRGDAPPFGPGAAARRRRRCVTRLAGLIGSLRSSRARSKVTPRQESNSWTVVTRRKAAIGAS